MTQVFQQSITEKQDTAVFPIHEYWRDIGQPDDLEQAQFDMNVGKSK